ncbi:MAG: cell division protein FtsL [bacterium]
MSNRNNNQNTNRAYKDKYTSKYRNIRYNYTSEAFDYDYDDSTYTPRPKPREENFNRPRTKRKYKLNNGDGSTKYVQAEKDVKIFSFKFVISVIIIMALLTCIVILEAKIIEQRFEMESLNTTLGELNEYNRYLEIELSKNLDLEYIEAIAINKLGMQRPSPHQIIYISVPKESYSETRIINTENIFEKLFE